MATASPSGDLTSGEIAPDLARLVGREEGGEVWGAGGVGWQQLELRKTVYYQCIINILLLHPHNHLNSHYL